MSEISKVYNQYQKSLESSQAEYEERLKKHSKLLKEKNEKLIKNFVKSFHDDFKNQIKRIEIKSIAEKFFETSDIGFVAIDASCHKEQSANFISFYGGAYGSKGTLSLSEPVGKIRYHRWELNKDVSMVAFVPLPPDVMHGTVDTDSEADGPVVRPDSEIGEVASLHTKIMQLAEIYLAYEMAKSSSVDSPRLIIMDNSIGGILGNTSFSPTSLNIGKGDFDGEYFSEADMQIALSHPFNKKLGIPSTKLFQPHFRVIAEASWRGDKEIILGDCQSFPEKHFIAGADYLEKIRAGRLDRKSKSFMFSEDPRASWKKSVRIFENVCEKLFKEKDPHGVCYKIRNSKGMEFFYPRDIMFLVGIGLRALIEICWRRKILLVGIVKDSMSRFFYRNFLGSINQMKGGNQMEHFSLPLTDRMIAELLPNIDEKIKAPWSTLDFDSCFMTIHSANIEGEWKIRGYPHPILREVTRPERIFLRSIVQFFLSEDKNISSHALFVDRLAYDGWDDKDSASITLETERLGKFSPLLYDEKTGPPQLQTLTMYLLGVLVRNHFPEALGYPDPLHQADWGAKSLKRRVIGLLKSSEWSYKARPLSKTFREIRDSFR